MSLVRRSGALLMSYVVVGQGDYLFAMSFLGSRVDVAKDELLRSTSDRF